MTENIKKWMLRADIEGRIFLLALLISVPYFGINIFFDFWYDAQLKYYFLDISLLTICAIFFYLRRYPRIRPILMNIFCGLIIAAFVYYWVTSAGIKGGAAYVFPVLSALVISISRGIFRYVFLVTLIALVFTLTSNWLPINGPVLYKNLLLEFFLNLIMLGLVLVIFKLALDKERNDLEKQNIEIDKLNRLLTVKSAELEDYNMEIKLIQQNLENLVDRKTEELHRESKKDLEFSFINAHLVRAPIANILAITQHLKKENPELTELEANALALDSTVRKIGKILSSED